MAHIGPPGSCRPQVGPMLGPWTLLSGVIISESDPIAYCQDCISRQHNTAAMGTIYVGFLLEMKNGSICIGYSNASSYTSILIASMTADGSLGMPWPGTFNHWTASQLYASLNLFSPYMNEGSLASLNLNGQMLESLSKNGTIHDIYSSWFNVCSSLVHASLFDIFF